MPRQKKIILAVESIHTDTLRSEGHSKYLTNFICTELNAVKCFEHSSRRDSWKEMYKPVETVQALLKERLKATKSLQFFGKEEIAIYEPNLSDKVKLSTDYIFRWRNSNDSSVTTDKYMTLKEVISEAQKRIKNKYVVALYDGNSEKIELNEENLGNIISRVALNTCTISLSSLDRSGNETDTYDITIYKNLMSL